MTDHFDAVIEHMETEILVAIIAAVPTLFSPIIGLLANRIGMGQRLRETELRLKKLELLEKAASLRQRSPDGNGKVSALIETTIESTLAYVLKEVEEVPEMLVRPVYSSFSRTKRLFLLFKPYSTKGNVFLILFYLNMLLTLFTPWLVALLVIRGIIAVESIHLITPALITYLVLTIIFRQLAVKDALKYEYEIGKLTWLKNMKTSGSE